MFRCLHVGQWLTQSVTQPILPIPALLSSSKMDRTMDHLKYTPTYMGSLGTCVQVHVISLDQKLCVYKGSKHGPGSMEIVTAIWVSNPERVL